MIGLNDINHLLGWKLEVAMVSAFENNGLIFPVRMTGNDEKSGEPGVAIADKTKLKKPPMYKVLLHNDDYTTMEFVIHVLMKFFNKTYDESHAIMLKVHNDGVGICGLYTHEVAESKSHKVNRYSRGKGHPLKSTIEPCDS